MGRPRQTRQKAAVLAAVRSASRHPDARWVYEKVSQEIPNISLGTVYRVLASLSAEGLIREYSQAGGPSLYDPNVEDHIHIRCRVCGRISDVPPVTLSDELLEEVRRASAFAKVEQARLEFDGVCAPCAAKDHP